MKSRKEAVTSDIRHLDKCETAYIQNALFEHDSVVVWMLEDLSTARVPHIYHFDIHDHCLISLCI